MGVERRNRRRDALCRQPAGAMGALHSRARRFPPRPPAPPPLSASVVPIGRPGSESVPLPAAARARARDSHRAALPFPRP